MTIDRLQYRFDVSQGSKEWDDAHIGKISSASARAMLAGEDTKTYQELIKRIIFEKLHLMRAPNTTPPTQWIVRGMSLEREARERYESLYGPVKEVGYIDNGLAITSPDGLIGNYGVLELKVPKETTHEKYLAYPGSLSKNYEVQVQFHLWVSRRPYANLVSYCPKEKLICEFVEKSPRMHRLFKERLVQLERNIRDYKILEAPVPEEVDDSLEFLGRF